jgi:hypothetical protein
MSDFFEAHRKRYMEKAKAEMDEMVNKKTYFWEFILYPIGVVILGIGFGVSSLFFLTSDWLTWLFNKISHKKKKPNE